jgi:hypothetical protein
LFSAPPDGIFNQWQISFTGDIEMSETLGDGPSRRIGPARQLLRSETGNKLVRPLPDLLKLT